MANVHYIFVDFGFWDCKKNVLFLYTYTQGIKPPLSTDLIDSSQNDAHS